MGEDAGSTYYLPAGLPAPVPARDGLDRPFWEGTRQQRLMIQRCRGCGAKQFPAEWVCHGCAGDDLEWISTAARGQVFSWERIWQPFHSALKESCPYLVVLVALDEAPDVRMLGNLLGDARQAVEIGAAVEAVFESHGDYALVQWRVSSQTAASQGSR